MSNGRIFDFKIKLIVAMSENGIIGNKGDIAWKLPEEMKHFKETTINNTVVMGFNTWKSLLPYNKEGYLKDRLNIVLSNDIAKVYDYSQKYDNKTNHYESETNLLFKTECSRNELKKLTHLHLKNTSNAFIIGGAQIYKYYLDNGLVDELIVTKVKMKLNGDTRLDIPYIDEKWTLISVDERKYFDIMYYQKRI